MDKIKLSKDMNVSSKYQITIPQNVRDVMRITKSDSVYFSTDGENIYFEKVKDNIDKKFFQLITILRQALHAGIPVFITGEVASGKSFLAKEVSSYGFSSVKYLGDTSFTFEDDLISFKEALDTAISTNDLLILDEYQLISQHGMGLSKDIVTAYKGALIVITQLNHHLPSQNIFSDHYYINFSRNIFSGEMDIELKYYKKNELKGKGEDTYLEINVNVPENTKLALTTNYIFEMMERTFAEYKFISHEALRAIALVKSEINTKNNSVNFIVEQIELLSESLEYQGENGRRLITILLSFVNLLIKGFDNGIYNTPVYHIEESDESEELEGNGILITDETLGLFEVPLDITEIPNVVIIDPTKPTPEGYNPSNE